MNGTVDETQRLITLSATIAFTGSNNGFEYKIFSLAFKTYTEIRNLQDINGC